MNQDANAKTEVTVWREFFRPFNFVTLVLAFVGFGLAYYFYKASQPVARLQYVIRTEQIANLDRADLAITKDGKPMAARTLYRTLVGVWNAGTVPIETSSIRRPLTIEFSPGTILDALMVRQSSTIMGVNVKADNESVVANWDHFDPSYYLIISVYHFNNDIARPSLRYIGDQEISEFVKADLTNDDVQTFIVAFGGFMGVVLLALVGGNIGEMIDNRVSKTIFATMLFFTLFICGLVYLYYAVTSNKLNSTTRSLFGMAAPAEISRVLEIDRVPWAR
jgi:hypothetical protein